MKQTENMDIIIPISLKDPKASIQRILMLHKKYGYTHFTLTALSKGWRATSYPPREHYIEVAEQFKSVKDALRDYHLTIGWFMTLSIKSGPSKDFTAIVRQDGTAHPFASCPLDPAFTKRLSEDVALFAKISKPDFIFIEDDFSISAASGCFCEKHLEEFAKREEKYYSREELVNIFSLSDDASLALQKRWNALKKDTLVSLAGALRQEVDKESPEIPMGCMQSGGCDKDGNSVFDIAKALAGPRHTPFIRPYGAFYCGVTTKEMPQKLYHPLHTKQHAPNHFICLQEADSYPHTRFYTAAKHMKSMMGAMLSYGFDGALFFLGQGLDDPYEDPAYIEMFAKEKGRFGALHAKVRDMKTKGVTLAYDPFYNYFDKASTDRMPLWLCCISRFGIPYTTTASDVAFWDMRQARHSDEKTVLEALSKGLFLDADAAKILCERGFGKYLGVEVADNTSADASLSFDLGAREIIEEKFVAADKGRQMPPAHAFCPAGSGKWYNVTVTNKNCEIVSGAYSSLDQLITPTMTRFKNELGGKVVVMNLTLDQNRSQALLNYRRQRLLQSLISWCSDRYVYAKEAPDIFLIANEATDPASDSIGMLTAINLNEDGLKNLSFHLPPHWKAAQAFKILTADGNWTDANVTETEDGITLHTDFDHCEPVYILATK